MPLTLIFLPEFLICSSTSVALQISKRIGKASAPLSFVRATGKFVFISEVQYQNKKFMYHL